MVVPISTRSIAAPIRSMPGTGLKEGERILLLGAVEPSHEVGIEVTD
jgi:hypothetical protein